MKTRSVRSLRRLPLHLRFLCDYTEPIGQLEKALARRPKELQLDMIGAGELPADMALLIRSILASRPPGTHLITHARSSLQNGAVLVWLLGDTRLIREDARLFFRKPNNQAEDESGEDWKEEAPSDAEADLEEADHAQVLRHIDNYLPVKELAGRPLGIEVLRQFGLVDNARLDRFLAAAFARTASAADSPTRSLEQPGANPGRSPPGLEASIPTRQGRQQE